MKKSSLDRMADNFRREMKSIKSRMCLIHGAWYPYDSLNNLTLLGDMFDNDLTQLLDLLERFPVLDLGCGDGDISFFFESLGAKVHAVDYGPTNHNAMTGVGVLKQVRGSQIEIHAMDLDVRFDPPAPRYGLTLLLGTLYHLKNPFSILETLAHRSNYCFLSTRIANFTPDRKTDLTDIPVAYLLEEAETNHDPTNYWIFSEAGLKRLLQRAGWNVIRGRIVGNVKRSDPVSTKGDARAFYLLRSLIITRTQGLTLGSGWHALEFEAWRWTARRFTVTLDAPTRSETARLELRFHLPSPVFATRSSVTLGASVNGAPLASETYTHPGAHVYSRKVPAPACPRGRDVEVEFNLNSAIGPTDSDRRELGVLVEFAEKPAIRLY